MTAAAISTAPPASAPPEDEELLAAWNAHGRRGDFEELVRRHLGLVQGTARRQLGDDLAEDTVQTVFAIFARKAPRLAGVRSLTAWLHRVTVLQCRSAIRRRQRERRHQLAAMQHALLHEGRDPLADILPHLDDALTALPDADRTLLLMRYSEGLTFAGAAARTGRSEAALRQQAGRALEKLSTLLRRRGVTVPAAAMSAGLGAVLGAQSSANAAAAVAGRALHGAGALSRGALWAATLSTMTTTQSILTGAVIAVLLAAGPVAWRAWQITEARQAPATIVPPPASPAPPATTAAAIPKSTEAPAAKPGPQSPMEELQDALMEEIEATAEEWARQTAWLEARRTGHATGLPRESEDALREFLENRTLTRLRSSFADNAPDKTGGRAARQHELAAWMQEHLKPEEFARWQEHERSRRAETVGHAAEEALHSVSAAVPLSEEQKTKLYDAAAAKAAAALDSEISKSSMSFGAAFATPPSPAPEDDAALLAQVLDPAQLELWEQSREQQRTFSEVMPRRVADRAMQMVRERGLGSIVAETLRTISAGDSAPTPDKP